MAAVAFTDYKVSLSSRTFAIFQRSTPSQTVGPVAGRAVDAHRLSLDVLVGVLRAICPRERTVSVSFLLHQFAVRTYHQLTHAPHQCIATRPPGSSCQRGTLVARVVDCTMLRLYNFVSFVGGNEYSRHLTLKRTNTSALRR